MALPVNGSTHLIPAYYSIYRPRKDERLSWPSWLTYSGWLTHISGQQRIRLSIETLCIYLVPLSRYIVGVAMYRKKTYRPSRIFGGCWWSPPIHHDLWHQKTIVHVLWCGVVCVIPPFSRFGATSTCEGQTDKRINRPCIAYHTSIASRGIKTKKPSLNVAPNTLV